MQIAKINDNLWINVEEISRIEATGYGTQITYKGGGYSTVDGSTPGEVIDLIGEALKEMYG